MFSLKKYSDKREDAFTLIEILVVIAIIGILAAIAIPVFLNQRKVSNDAAVESDVKNLAVLLQDLPGDAKNFSRVSTTQVAYLSEGTTKRTPVTMSNNMWWTVSGNHLQYCIIAYNLNGEKYTSDNPLYYDSVAGGLGKKGAACNPTDSQDSSGNYVSQGNHFADASLSGYDIPIARTDYKDLLAYFGMPFKTVATTTPVGNKALEGTTNGSNVQGIIMTQLADNAKSRPVQKSGEKWVASIYVKAPAGEPFNMGVRTMDANKNYLRETGGDFVGTGNWERVTYMFTSTTSDIGNYPGLQVKQRVKNANIVYQYAGPQIELGTTATAFKG